MVKIDQSQRKVDDSYTSVTEKITAGMNVEHQRFGKGIVKEIEGASPNQKAIIQKDSTPSETEVVEFQNFDLEVQSKLVFDRTALGDILQVLNSTHGVNISLSNENMKNCILTVDLTDLTVEMSMEILTKAVQAEYTTKGNDFMIIGEGCGTQR